MFVRTASARDLDAVRALLVETWHDTYDPIYGVERVNQITAEWHSLEALASRMASPNSEFLVADDGQRIGGMAYASTQDEGSTVMLRQLYVLPACQGQGIGGMLLDEIEGSFPGADRLRLEVETRNAKAVAFYHAQGFAEIGKAELEGKTVTVLERPIVWAE
ncbi:GNAT family N-acetyltransferase [Mesorhizobium sp. CAU 1741]|uniref:GNAT family N-acetyltransferase n=1 Tax=Mesorhizobium sp. CAU 1741 TaxID=3140366 RepID=UPI00325A6F61